MTSQASNTSILILRSACVGVAGVVIAAVGGLFVGGFIAALRTPPSPDGEVGWSFVVTPHDYPVLSVVLPLLAFAIGFAIGFRYFSRAAAG
jgi:hypothetical protein